MLWGITSYFNPAGYSSRRRNFRAFREQLALPLVTVEWSPSGDFELGESDSDVLLSLSGGGLMWQKERLLNVALRALPPDCDVVAWLDCDIVFDRDSWVDEVDEALSNAALVQLFSEVRQTADPSTAAPLLVRDSLGSVLARQGEDRLIDRIRPRGVVASNDELDERRRLATRPSSGHGWAAHRELLESHGLYDACICGAGDMAIALAAAGLQDQFDRCFPLSAAHQRHYQTWANRFAAATRGKVAVLEGGLQHLFHGNLANRRYRERLEWLAGIPFDPLGDLSYTGSGLWKWRVDEARRESWLSSYFAGRREDDAVAPTHVFPCAG